MEYRADGLPRSGFVRAGGFLGGILLATPAFYVVFGAAASVLSWLPTDLGVPGTTVLQFVLALVAATAASGTSLFGYEWFLGDGRSRAGLFAGAVLATAGAVVLVAAFLFLDAIAWGRDHGSLPVVGFGVAGVLALTWAGVRAGQGALAGYRDVE
jgi:hypothetical protein